MDNSIPLPKGNGQLVYCATPSKLAKKTKKILNFVSSKGYAPFHPFQGFPYNLFEGNSQVGRQKAMNYCMRAIKICDEFWIFGLSDGTKQELEFAKKLNKPIRIIKLFDKNKK